MSWEPEGSAFPGFPPRTAPAPTLRVPERHAAAPVVAAPRRGSRWPCRSGPSTGTSGSTATVTMEPGGSGFSRETKGWSIHPPANAMR